MKNQFKQTREMRGSFINSLMGNNSTMPKVGEGATICMYSDRHAYEVIEVTNDGKRAVIQRYKPTRVDKLGMSDAQSYEYKELTEEKRVIVWYRGKWRQLIHSVVFTDEFHKRAEEGIDCKSFFFPSEYLKEINPDAYVKLYPSPSTVVPQKVIQGVTRLRKNYDAVSILWGTKEEYYDFSF